MKVISLVLDGQDLATGDSLAMRDAAGIQLSSIGDSTAEVLLFDVPL